VGSVMERASRRNPDRPAQVPPDPAAASGVPGELNGGSVEAGGRECVGTHPSKEKRLMVKIKTGAPRRAAVGAARAV